MTEKYFKYLIYDCTWLIIIFCVSLIWITIKKYDGWHGMISGLVILIILIPVFIKDIRKDIELYDREIKVRERESRKGN